MACINDKNLSREVLDLINQTKLPQHEVIGYVQLWQKNNSVKNPETYPTVEQLKELQKQEKSNVQQENISSKGSDFAKKLTNIGNNLQVEYKDKVFRNAEHAYQTWKSGEFDEIAYNSKAFKPRGSKKVNTATNYQTMVEIITAKLQQHPELIQGINERGGLKYLQNSTHNVIGDSYWETSGQNNFIKALIDSYNNVSDNKIQEEKAIVEAHKQISDEIINESNSDTPEQDFKTAIVEAKKTINIESSDWNKAVGHKISPIFTKEEIADIRKSLGTDSLKVLSVSKHTDPIFFSEIVLDFLENNAKKPLTDKTRTLAMELWTKHDGVPMREMLTKCRETKVAPIVSFSVTGLGGSNYEKGVLKSQDLLPMIKQLIDEGLLNPLTTTIRIDPILPGVTNLKEVQEIVRTASSYGIVKFVTSIVQSYGYTQGTSKDRLVIKGINDAHNLTTGEDYDWDKYYGTTEYGKHKGKYNFKPKQEYINEIGNALLELKNENSDLVLETCAFKIDGFNDSACLDPFIVSKVTGINVIKDSKKDKITKDNLQYWQQNKTTLKPILNKDKKVTNYVYIKDDSRKDCDCYGVRGSIPALDEKICVSSCAYCYASHSGDSAFDYYDDNGDLKNSKYSNLNFTEDTKSISVNNNNTNNQVSKKESVPLKKENPSLHLTFNPKTRRSRVSMLSKLFSQKIQEELDKKSKEIDEALSVTNNSQVKTSLLAQKEGLDKRSIALQRNPEDIFKSIENYFQKYLSFPEEVQTQIRTARFNQINKNLNITEEEKAKLIQESVKHFQVEYQKILDNFPALLEEVAPLIKQTYGISFNVISNKLTETNSDLDSIEDNESETNISNSAEDTGKDGWMLKVRETSLHETLSIKMKEYLATIPKLNINNMQEFSDLQEPTYLDGSYTFATILDISKEVITAEDIIPTLSKHINTKPWLKIVVNNLIKNPELVTDFFTAFNSDSILMWVQKNKHDNNTGLNVTQTIPVNQTLSINHLFDLWRDNYLGGLVLTENSIYDNNSNLLPDKAEANIGTINKIIAKINKINTNKVKQQTFLEDNPEYLNTTIDLLKSVGVSNDNKILEKLLLTSNNQAVFTSQILQNLNTIFNGVYKEEVSDRGELINTFKSSYNKLAQKISTVSELMFEASVTEAGKTYYAHSVPTYLGTLVKEIQGKHANEERYQKFIEEEYKQYNFFYKNGMFLNHWVELLANNPELRQQFERKTLLNIDKREYADWSEIQILKSAFAEYTSIPNNNTKFQYAYYKVPIRSDNQTDEYIKFVKYTKDDYKKTILNQLYKVVFQEFNRIQDVKSRKEEAKVNPDFKPIKHYDKNGDRFLFIPELNDVQVGKEGKSFLEQIENAKSINDENGFKALVLNALNTIMENHINSELKKAEDLGIFEQEELNKEESKTKDPVLLHLPFSDINVAKDNMINYFWNNTLAQIQMKQILGGDIAFYDGEIGFQKRFKQITSPATKPNTKAVYNGEVVGKESEKVMYIQDEEIVSTAKEYLTNIFIEKHKQGEMSDYELADVLSKYGYSNHSINNVPHVKVGDIIKRSSKVNVTDGQSFRTLPSMRIMAIMLNDWSKAKEKSYQNILKGKWSISDFNTLLQSVKPFYYGQIPINTTNGRLKVPVQHKNSEAVLLAMYDFIGGETSRSPKLKALNKFMINNNIDVVHFNSVIKVGEQGAFSLPDVNDEQVITDALDKAIYGDQEVNKGLVGTARTPISNVIRNIPTKYYGKQNSIPEKALDKGHIVGTQMKKLSVSDIFANLSKEMENDMPREELIEKGYFIEVGGEKFTRKELLQHYNEMFLENYLESYFGTVDKNGKTKKEGLEEAFKNLPNYLVESVIDNPRYGSEMLKALKSNLPYFEGNISESIQMLATSLIKSQVTKQKIKGGTLIQVSDWGMTEDLSIAFKNKDGVILNKKSIENSFKKENGRYPTTEEYANYARNLKDSGSIAVAHLECYMPAYSKKMILPFLKEGTNELDIEKMPDDLRRIIGYRIPTENKYSILPIYIKGFLPQNMGSAIMLPAEVTTIMGADFDIDKLNMIYPEFKTIEVLDTKKVKQALYKAGIVDKKDDRELDFVLGRVQRNATIGGLDVRIEKVVKANKPIFYKTKFKKIKYDRNKTAEQNGLAARNNRIFDIIWSVLTHPDTASKLLTPGGFTTLEKDADIITTIKNISEQKYNELTNNGKLNILEVLNNTDNEELSNLAQTSRTPLHPTSIFTQIELHQRNMAGVKLIGINANHGTHHALMQQTNLGVSELGQFKINGYVGKSLNDAIATRNIGDKKDVKVLISNNLAEPSAASVDNAKNPVLGFLNQNIFTAHVNSLGLRLGYTLQEMNIVLNQPIVLEMTKLFFKNADKGMTKHQAVTEVLSKYKKLLNFKDTTRVEYDINRDFDTNEYVNYILPFTPKNRNYYNKQFYAGLLFQQMLSTSTPLAALTSIKPDTSDGGANGTIAKVKSAMIKIKDAFSAKEDSLLTNVDFLNLGLKFINKQEAREAFNKTLIPWYQAVYTLGLERAVDLLKDYFPHFNDAFNTVIDSVVEKSVKNTLSEKTLKSLYNQMFVYLMSNNEFFGNEIVTLEDGTTKQYSIQDKRLAYLSKYPDYFLSKVKQDSELSDVDFLQRFNPVSANKNNKFKSLKFKNTGKSNITIKEGYILDWEALTIMDNETANNIAFNLVKYEYYNNGFGFGHSSSAHLTPTSVKLQIPGYVDSLNDIMEKSTYTGTPDPSYLSFVDMFIYNNLKNPELVKESTYQPKEDSEIISIPLDTDLGVTKRKGMEHLDIDPVYFDYIKIKTKDGFNFYKRLYSNEQYVTYKKITPLNMEYDFNSDADTMSSVYEGTIKDVDSSDSNYLFENDGVKSINETEINLTNIDSYSSNDDATDANDQKTCI